MDMSITEAYETLQLAEGANTDDIILNFKKLALECHPDRHSQTDESFQNFNKICGAFLRLTKTDEKERKKPLTVKRMFQLFEEVFFGEAASTQNGYPYFHPDSCDEDDSDDACDDNDYNGAVANNNHSSPSDFQPYELKLGLIETETHAITPEEANKNADILVAEEEKERKKAEKRKAKKKKRKEKKKQEKELSKQTDKKQNTEKFNGHDFGNHSTGRNKKDDSSDSDEDSKSEEELDPSSAFALASTKTKPAATGIIRNSKPEKISINKDTKQSSMYESNISAEDHSAILRSRNLAIRGNDMASLHRFQEAIELFSEAIRLNPKDFRFYGNRSYCFDKLEQYDKALKDADKAIQLDAGWPKNYYRRGRALSGLKKYTEAEASFEQVMKLDKSCEDAEQELLEVRARQIMELGFTRSQAVKSLERHKTIQVAIDSLLNSTALDCETVHNDMSPTTLNEVYMSDEDSFPSPVMCPKKIPPPQARDIKMDPNNPEGLASLWIGNVSKDMKEKTMRQLFANYGTVISMRLLPEKFCAFVNFADKQSASRAMKELQGILYCGQRLLIKFPEKMGSTQMMNNVKKTATKSISTVSVPLPNKSSCSTNNSQPKATGPVKDGECYFWRTTGCSYGDTCRHKHVSANKGIDLKSWHM